MLTESMLGTEETSRLGEPGLTASVYAPDGVGAGRDASTPTRVKAEQAPGDEEEEEAVVDEEVPGADTPPMTPQVATCFSPHQTFVNAADYFDACFAAR